ncbi:S-adenosyl-L-methionine-dependent methyltransferase [Daldinia caldariorum]|uniref:S-adenosyl-L-methionine-dependent methyltransferase n=1 Tax=Daldinia caldariorum TaxID=326644 RepID=UPI002008C5E9|nr:S-adenosyl-L-methionine-dependent methyltransferase [Daldinia caldariorum]KAI1467564.1 S-adenosyl-L-methionine-dependent methyltransferase [Daldinia caldariorum]
MLQSIYDQQDFFENYIKLDRRVKGLEGVPEWLQLKTMLPDLDGLTVLDLGCGFGRFSRFARENGSYGDQIRYERAGLEELRLGDDEYDLVFSSLAFHYAANIAGLIKEIGIVLKPSGRTVCSIEHSIYTAPSRPKFIVDEEAGGKSWLLDGYE